MRRAAAIQHLRQVASMGFGGAVAIPEMLRALGDIVPGSFNSFFWIEPDGQLIDAYAPVAVSAAYDVLVVNYDQLRASDEPTFDKIIAVGLDVGAARALHARHDYSRSAIRNEVWRAFGIGLGLDLILREGGKPRAILFVNRDARQSRFSEAEARTLLELRPHFLHALSGLNTTDYEVDDHESDIGVIMADPQGRVISGSPAALRIMLEFADVPFGPAQTFSGMMRELPPPLRLLLDRLRRVSAGMATEPALVERRTRRGVYRAKAFPQTSVMGGSPDCVVLILTRHLPRGMAVLRRMEATTLSPRERQLAYHIGMGSDPDVSARAIGVTPATGRSYLKSIYRKLDVPGRPGLMTTLQTGRLIA